MNKGFNKIVVNKKEDVDIITTVTKFLCIYPYVKIELDKKQK